MLATIVATNSSTAQFMFLVAVIVCAVSLLLGILEKALFVPLLVLAILFVALGLLFSS